VRAAATVVATVVLFFLSLIAAAFAQPQSQAQPASRPQPVATPPSQTPTSTPANQSPGQAGEEVGDDDVIKVTTNLVTSAALVVGRDRKYVPTLRREDFHVFEDGVEQQLAYFAPVDRPFTVALLIDNSRSTIFELADIQSAAISFVNQIRANDRVLIISLADGAKALAGPTTDKQELRQAIANLKPGGDTRLFDAVDLALKNEVAGIPGRRAIILLTDGVDNASANATYQTNLRDIAKSDVQMYAVQFSTYASMSKQAARSRRAPPEGSGFSRVDYQRADAYLHQVSEMTGTTVFPAVTVSNLDAAIASIAEELHNEYSIGYYPRIAGKPGEVRRVEVRVGQPWLTVRARTNYSFGKSEIARTENTEPEIAPLTEIEARSPAFIEDKRPLNARWICKGPFVPAEYALVQEGFDSKCPRSGPADDKTNAWFIRKPGPSEVVCKGLLWWNGSEMEISTVPSGYVVVGEEKSTACSSSIHPQKSANAWRVKRPTAEETVCKGFLIPRGFVVVGEKKAAVCPATQTRAANAWLIVPTPYIETRSIWTVP